MVRYLFLPLIFALVNAEIRNICNITITNTPHKVSLCTTVKNEAFYLKEWISYHLLMKVDHFYVYNDQSTDNITEVLAPFIKQGVVTLIPWDHEKQTVDPSLVVPEPPFTRSQRFSIADCLYNHKNESEWFGIWDVDEFVSFNNSFANMHEFIEYAEQRYDEYHIPLTTFGSSGYLKTPSGLVLENYFWRSNFTIFGTDPNTKKFSGKSLYKSGCGQPSVHFSPHLPNGCRQHAGWMKAVGDNSHVPIKMNHYAIKSWEHFKEKLHKWHFDAKKERFDQLNFTNQFLDYSQIQFAKPVRQLMDCFTD
eukprot:Phypoly_transcript_13717.p1 GENE.Phypoly_transcript_13717~~Phypoly_transcript_13717.p1  ORF type:complete len:307 (-),score=47.02 Phypoly_transcript_13717:43-963(-)